jgi:hypothetical protein
LQVEGIIAVPKGARRETRPADVIGTAARIAKLAAGEDMEEQHQSAPEHFEPRRNS